MDVGRLRLRLSLFCRSLVALGVLGTFTLAVTVVVTLIGILLGAMLLGFIGRLAELFVASPRLSTFLPVSPAVLAVSGFASTVVVGWVGLSSLGARVRQWSPRSSVVVVLVWLGCLYTLLVETGAVLEGLFSSTQLLVAGFLFVLCLGAVSAVWSTVSTARRELGRLREQLLDGSEPAAETRPALADTASRLAQQVGVPAPTLRITDTDRPESFTLGSGSEAVIVVSTCLIDRLTDAEVTAVLAHEVSHLANADSRIMGAVLVPVLMAEELLDGDSSDTGEYVLNTGLWLLKRYGQFGVAILSRGREWYADSGAVALTGSPAALASALSKLSETRQTPSTDLREWEQSVGALDILPPSDREHATGPFRSHPSTDKRIERLRRRAADQAQSRTAV